MRTEEIILNLDSDTEYGLTARKAEEKRAKYGENKLNAERTRPLLLRFIDQFKDVMIIILIIAAAISFGVAIHEGVPKEFFEPILILAIVIINAVIGVVQEGRAQKALQALKDMSAPSARVIRDGQESLIDAVELVPGDIIRLEAGDFVPADARLIKSSNLKSEESALTGESVPAEKDAKAEVADNVPLGDRTNMIFSGCSITYGTATAIVTDIGMGTEMGRIADLLKDDSNSKTPLQEKLATLGKYLGIVALAVCAVIFVIGILSKMEILDIFMVSVSLAVSAIPEGLPAIITIVLSIGVQRMVKKNAIIRRLPAVETLGSASIICSDKTGTLTQNRMTVVKGYVDTTKLIENISSKNSVDIKEMLKYATLCCDGTVNEVDGRDVHIGDPTETAIVVAAKKNALVKERLSEIYPRVAEVPFDSERKLMSTVNVIDGQHVVIVKGAFDILESRCIVGDLKTAKMFVEEMSTDALRVLGVAYKKLDKMPTKITSENLESGLTFMGLVGMIDPARPEAKDAVAICKEAGIRPIMITGDHIATATAIARQLGIFNEGDRAITGIELDQMSDAELFDQVSKISVYARVSPENKIRIVKAWQSHDQVVAMTGDGVNDAPALKASDIGCAMGITGTDVAKGAADMTLTDDNFATIVDAVREGRGIYANIRKVVGFLLGTNVGEILTVFFAMLLWQKTPLVSMQLLWINLVTDGFPAIALGMEAVDEDIMSDKPKPKREGIFAGGLGMQVILRGILFAVLTLTGFYVGERLTGSIEGGQTLAFLVLSFAEIVQAFNMRSDLSLFTIGMFSNTKLNGATALSAFLVLLVMLITPLRTAFGLILLPLEAYLVGLGLVLVPLVFTEVEKRFRKTNTQKLSH